MNIISNIICSVIEGSAKLVSLVVYPLCFIGSFLWNLPFAIFGK